MQLVVPSAVKNAVSAATTTFTANSINFCFFIFSFQFLVLHLEYPFPLLSRRGRGGLIRLGVSPPEFLRPFGSKRAELERGGVRGGLKVRLFRPPRPSGSPPNSGGEDITPVRLHRYPALPRAAYWCHTSPQTPHP